MPKTNKIFYFLSRYFTNAVFEYELKLYTNFVRIGYYANTFFFLNFLFILSWKFQQQNFSQKKNPMSEKNFHTFFPSNSHSCTKITTIFAQDFWIYINHKITLCGVSVTALSRSSRFSTLIYEGKSHANLRKIVPVSYY